MLHRGSRRGCRQDLRPLGQSAQRGPHSRADDRRSVSRVEAAVRSAPARAVPARLFPLVRAVPGGVPVRSRVVECARVPRRPDVAAGGSAVERHRADPHDQPARSGTRQPAVRGFRTGGGGGMPPLVRDPVRDNLLFVDFAQGVVVGCLLLAGLSGLNYERLFGKLSFVPLLGSCVLSVLLILFGRGPGTSDAKVNLFGFQPVELIRILLVFFLAGYFARRWDILRHARETRASLAALTRRFDIPPVEYTLPALVSVALSLAFFFLQKDMGPALVFACLFLVLYGMARRSAAVPVAGLALMGGGLLFGYVMGVPHTVRERVSMWLSPWDNATHGR